MFIWLKLQTLEETIIFDTLLVSHGRISFDFHVRFSWKFRISFFKKLKYLETALINSINKKVVSLDILGSVVQIEFQNGHI